jgi:hypothetical protein
MRYFDTVASPVYRSGLQALAAAGQPRTIKDHTARLPKLCREAPAARPSGRFLVARMRQETGNTLGKTDGRARLVLVPSVVTRG